LSAADDPFCGTWKLNKDKSQVVGLREEITDVGNNTYKFKFGDDTQTIVLDGKQHPSKYGGTWSVKQDGPKQWTMVMEHGGKVDRTETWTLSDDGNQMNMDAKGTRPDGSNYSETMNVKRISGGPGMLGTWESAQAQFAATDWEIKAWGSDGLSFVTPAYSEHLDIKFDGKDYPDHGPRVSPGSTSSAKRPDPNTIEMTDKIKGKVMDTQDMKVSDDGKTLTVTVHFPGEEKTQTYVYEKAS
jgi:hypothetical protein